MQIIGFYTSSPIYFHLSDSRDKPLSYFKQNSTAGENFHGLAVKKENIDNLKTPVLSYQCRVI